VSLWILVEAHQTMANNNIPAIVHAAAIAYGFVFIHLSLMETVVFIVF